ncbi:MAG: adenosylcobalamin-dependent ribonucleoside-diphosphate reductase, partial [Flavobacteriales bacterium]|nr:adenosylcobalamin-dependent ribonucleoside-diphosphate reductase [Flavobacteriales bacterium]
NGSTGGDESKTYSYEEALAASINYFDGDELAASVWINKYALKDSFGNIYECTPADLHRRMAKEIARIELRYPNPVGEDEIFEALDHFRHIVPQGGPMTGIGNNFQIVSLSNCFVIGAGGNADSYGAVMRMDEEQVQLMKRRGGVGHDLSHIRPKGTPVKNSALTSTGLVPFMERYSNSTREVAQDGRRGALMLSVSIKHPDAEKFIDAKMDGTKVTGANVSVRIDDDFMRAVVNGTPYIQQFPINAKDPKVTQEIDAAALWQKIIHNAWKSAEPGILFWDTIIRESVPDRYADLGFRTVSTNPCGEIPLCPYDSCRLIALNLMGFVEDAFTTKAKFNFDSFSRHVRLAQRMMDDIIDLELEKVDTILAKIEADPEPEELKAVEHGLWSKIREKCIQGRRTGVGVTAEGDMLAALGIRYGAEESITFCTQVHQTLAVEAYRSSVEMARERGAFPIYDSAREEGNPFVERIAATDPDLYEEMKQYGRRNIALLTVAPTGTTSLMTQTTSGIEPAFMVAYKRRRKVNPNDRNVKVDFVDEVGDSWEEFHVLHHGFSQWLKVNGYDPDSVAKCNEKELEALIAKSPYYNACANDVDWLNKVRLQGSVQKWVDHSISVTVNVPNSATEELVADIYRTGWETGCKGITVYRDGSRSGVLISNDEKKESKASKEPTGAMDVEARPAKRPDTLDADVVRFRNGDQEWVAVVGLIKGHPYEIFTGKAKDSFYLPDWVQRGQVMKHRTGHGTRYDFRYEDREGYGTTIEGLSRMFDKEYWNYAKLISGVLRHGMPLPYVVNLIENLHLDAPSLNNWKNGVARALKGYIQDGTVAAHATCSACGEDALVYEEGCLNCKNCGHSKCG